GSLRLLSGPPQLLSPVGRLARMRTEWPLRHAAPGQPLHQAHVTEQQKGPVSNDTGPFDFSAETAPDYLILASLNSTCLRTTGSYLLYESFSVWVRAFFLVT